MRVLCLAVLCSVGTLVNPVPLGAGGGETTGPGLPQQSIEGRGICARVNSDGTVDQAPSYACKLWKIMRQEGGWLFLPSEASTGRNVTAVHGESRVRRPRARRP